MKSVVRMVMVLAVVGLVVSFTHPADADDIKAVWEKSCGSCHGVDGKGDTKAGKKLDVKDLTAAEVKAGFDKERMIETVKEGIVDEESGKKRMKAYADKLSDDQIIALVDHIFTLAK